MNDELDQLKSKVLRGLRGAGNNILDLIKELEQTQQQASGSGFEHIGTGEPQYAPPKSASEKTLRDYYANLEVDYGADLDTVKESYRRLMRQYHPDKYTNDPRMEALATELTQELTHAYRAIESYIKTGKY